MSSEQGSPSVLPTLTGAETQEYPLQGGDSELSFPSFFFSSPAHCGQFLDFLQQDTHSRWKRSPYKPWTHPVPAS